jgi:glycosyltransferase involved in cell wall biosynthesis
MWYFYNVFTNKLEVGSVSHIQNFMVYHSFLEQMEEVPKRLVFTLHNSALAHSPVGEYSDHLSRLSSAIVLYSQDIERFESYVGKGRVKFVHHGVNIDFFRPRLTMKRSENPRLLFIGRVFRDTAMLARIIKELTAEIPKIGFDLVVSSEQREKDPYLISLLGQDNIRWHTKIPDDKLLDLYQQSYLLLLPLTQAGANNAIVEALSSGLPIVTTGVGGVFDYGGGSIYPTVNKDDDAGMLSLIDRYLSDLKWRDEVAAAGREFAVSNLGWPLVAQRHIEIYEELCY